MCSLGTPGEEGNTTLVPNIAWDALSWDHDRGDQIGPLLVQVDWNLDQLLALLLVNLALVHPLEVDQRERAAQRLCQLDRLVSS